MNKWQIICPVVAMAIVALVMMLRTSRRERDYIVQMVTYSVGKNIIATTNSSHVVEIDPALQVKLSELLASPTHIARVFLGDEPSPIGDGSASSRLTLTNEVGAGLTMRLRVDNNSGPFQFRILSSFSPTEQAKQ